MKIKSIHHSLALLTVVVMLMTMMPAVFAQGAEAEQADLMATSVDIISQDGYQFKDLNKNSVLDPYEDWRLPAEQRAQDLLSQMTANEKAAQMVHLTLVTMKESWFRESNVGFALAYTFLSEGAEAAVTLTNQVQQLSEESRLGIPVVLSMDSVVGASWVDGATFLPDQLTLAATGDVELVQTLADIQRQEMLALGVRMSLSPVADIATDPRWARVQECFGEDSVLAAQMVVAAIEGLQGGRELTAESVMACVKHFPGSGAQTAGVDGTPLVYDDDTFPVALNVFQAAIEAGAAAIMPYGYSKVPYLGGDAVDNYAHESSVVMTDLLRGELGFEGIIQTDWGLNHVFAALAGADVLGGAGSREIQKLADNLTAEQLDERVYRILLAKFEMGIFENPYSDVNLAVETVGVDAHLALAYQAASEAMTLVKYENMTALDNKKILLAGSLAEDKDALNSGWKISGEAGLTIRQALEERIGAANVTYIGDDAAAVCGIPNTQDTIAIVVVGEKSGTHEPAWGSSTLEFPEEQENMVRALHSAGIPVIAVVLLGRAYVMTDVVDNADAVLIAYRPGVSKGAEAIIGSLYGDTPIQGKLPLQIPATMNQILMQREDLAMDIVDPLFEYGFGITVTKFGE